jgi:hypothetical protein
MSRSQPCRNASNRESVIEFLTHGNKTPAGIRRRLLAFCVEDTVDVSTVRHLVIKSRDSGGNLERNNQLTHQTGKNSTNSFNKIDENQIRDLREDPKDSERTNQSR